MAISILKSEFKTVYDKARKKFKSGYVKPIGAVTLVEFVFGSPKFVDSCLKGTDLVIEQFDDFRADLYKKLNTRENWVKVLANYIKEIKQFKAVGAEPIMPYNASKSASPLNGLYFGNPSRGRGASSTSMTLLIWASNAGEADSLINSIYESVTDDMWSKFVNDIVLKNSKSLFSGQESSNTTEDAKTRSGTSRRLGNIFRGGINREHDSDSTRALLALQNLESAKLGINTGVSLTTTDITDYIFDNLKVDWEQKTKKTKFANFSVQHVLTLSLGTNKSPGTDTKDLQDIAAKFIEEEVNKSNLLTDVQKKRSKSLAKETSEDVIQDLFKQVKNKKTKNFKITKKLKSKKFKSGTRSGNIKAAANKAPVKRALTIRKVGRPAKGRKTNPEAGRENLNILSLKRKINQRLPAEVRRNMGKPALTNQTGRFSNSVELVNLRQGPNTLVGEYTYMHNPYRTFENAGQRQWPAGYDPKPLITKSIRNLAIQHVENKFTLRRV